jgi:hypothetical protein
MSRTRVAAERLLDAPAAVVYHCLAGYRELHPGRVLVETGDGMVMRKQLLTLKRLAARQVALARPPGRGEDAASPSKEVRGHDQ